MCLNPDLEGPPLEAYTIQGQYAIPQPDLTKLHQLAMQQSHFPMTHGNTGFSAGLDASAQTTSHELTIPNDVSKNRGCATRNTLGKKMELQALKFLRL